MGSPPLVILPFRDRALDRAGLVEVVSGAFVHDRWVTDPQVGGERLSPMFGDGALSEALASLERPEARFCLLGHRGERVVGVAIGWVEERIERFSGVRVGTLWSLAVRPGSRRQGVAEALLEASLDWMQARGCAQLSVSTDEGNPAAELYRKRGAALHHRLDTFVLPLAAP